MTGGEAHTPAATAAAVATAAEKDRRAPTSAAVSDTGPRRRRRRRHSAPRAGAKRPSLRSGSMRIVAAVAAQAPKATPASLDSLPFFNYFWRSVSLSTQAHCPSLSLFPSRSRLASTQTHSTLARPHAFIAHAQCVDRRTGEICLSCRTTPKAFPMTGD